MLALAHLAPLQGRMLLATWLVGLFGGREGVVALLGAYGFLVWGLEVCRFRAAGPEEGQRNRPAVGCPSQGRSHPGSSRNQLGFQSIKGPCSRRYLKTRPKLRQPNKP